MLAVLAVLAGGMGTARAAQAFPRNAAGHFDAASRVLAPYGVTVMVDVSSGHHRLGFGIADLPTTEYGQVVGTPDRLGEIVPCIKTSGFGDGAGFTALPPGRDHPLH